MVGGNVGFNYSNKNLTDFDQKTEEITLASDVIFGYSIAKNFMMGAGIEYIFKIANSDLHNLDFKTQNTDYILSPFMRFYTNSPLFIQAQLNLGSSKSLTESYYIDSTMSYIPYSLKSEFSLIGIGAEIGYDLKLFERIFLVPSVNYNFNYYFESNQGFNGSSRTDYTLSNFIFSLGLIYRF
jgi:hypothetical protein